MRRMTTDKATSEMNMTELAHNCMYARDGWARYRDFEQDMDLRDFIREFSRAEGAGELTKDNEVQEELLLDNLQYWIDSPSGRVALVYRLMWALGDLREHLKKYEDIGLEPESIEELKEKGTARKMQKPNPNVFCCPECGETLDPMWSNCPWCGQRVTD